MCGIIGNINKTDVVNNIIDGLHQLQNRGYDSTGICTIKNNKYNVIKYASTENVDALHKLVTNKENIIKGNVGIGHTRWATHGSKTDLNAHPHVSYNEKVCLVHNGIIENYIDLRLMLQKKNITFKSSTDSEVICNLIAYHYEESDNFLTAIKKSISLLEGTWGLCLLNIDEPNTMYCIRRGSPLLVGYSDDNIMVVSEQSGFHNNVNNYFILDTNDICIIKNENGKLTTDCKNSYKTKNIILNNNVMTPYPYDHWTLKEIYEQYDASIRAISFGGRLINENEVKLGGLELNKHKLIDIDNLIFVGCGTSYNAAMYALSMFKEICDFNTVQLFDAAEFSKHDIPRKGNTALVLLSQSGETKDVHRSLLLGKKYNLFTIGVINVVDSMIARETHCGCYVNAGREVGVASTKSFLNQSIVLSMMALWFSQIKNLNITKRHDIINDLRNLPNDISKTLYISENCIDTNISIVDKPSIFVLGKGDSYSIAQEGALKIKELTYIHAEAYSTSSLKHGPFALLDKNVPVILLVFDNKYFSKNMSAYEEITSRNSPVLVISNKEIEYIDNIIYIPKNRTFAELLSIIPLQFLSYHIALKKKINMDKPRNLAKICTVD